MRKIIFLSIFSISLFSCTRNKDKLKSISFGNEDYKTFVKKSIKEKLFFEPDKDTCNFRYFIEETKELQMEIIVNPDGYEFRKTSTFSHLYRTCVCLDTG